MAIDFKSSLPVRSEADGLDSRVQVKVVDKSNPGTQQMTVDSDSNAHVEMHGNNPSGTDTVVRLSQQGSPNGDGIYDGTNNTIPASAGVTAQVRNAAYSASRQTLAPTAKRGAANTDTVSMDISLHDENGDAYSIANPMPVAISNEEAGTAIHTYAETASPIAPAGSQQVDYTVATSNLTLKRICAAASGECKIEIFTGASAGPTQRYALFTSAANHNILLDIPKNFIVVVGDIIRVKFTSMEPTGTDAFTGYVTIEGMQ
jgi:hypothetical protein